MTLAARIDDTRELLARIEGDYAPAALASSFGAEDMVLIDLIAKGRFEIGIFTLDTGRLPKETLDLIEKVRSRYGLAVEVFTPRSDSVAAYVDQYGRDGFYESVEARKACCGIRKVEPLQRALQGRHGWITGLRREQAESRATISAVERDEAHGILKFNPLADWTNDDVWEYLRANDVPWNALHDRGYPSIGCEPCTRAVKPGEHPRAGRWWWEQEDGKKECGLHVIPIREAVRA
jgi:phosphoadenosine phosphosulfate reductase